MKVKEIMSPEVETLDSNQSIKEAAEKMKDLNVGDIPVRVDGDVVGIVTDRDIFIRAVAHGLDPKSAPIVDAMTEGVYTCREDDEIEDAARLMGEKKVRRLPVIDDNNNILGIVSLGDVALHADPDRIGRILAHISR